MSREQLLQENNSLRVRSWFISSAEEAGNALPKYLLLLDPELEVWP